jgi:hypothetical protein
MFPLGDGVKWIFAGPAAKADEAGASIAVGEFKCQSLGLRQFGLLAGVGVEAVFHRLRMANAILKTAATAATFLGICFADEWAD